MSAPDLTSAIMAQFAASGADKHLTLLLGAGASVASGLPDWNELAVRLLLRSGAVRDRRLAELLVREQDPLLVAEAAKQSLGSEWEASVRQALYSAPESPSPSTLHFAVAQHMLEGAHSNTTLITLNFDTLLEQALRVVSLRESRLLGPLAGECFEASVHHLHGVVGSVHVRDLVLTLTDYNEILSAGLSWQQALLRHSLRQGAVLIVGTTYRDPDVRKWFHHVLQNNRGKHSALVLLVRQAFRLNQEEFEGIREALTHQWRSVGMDPVLAVDFSDAVQIVQELAHVHQPNYLSPQERTKLIWDEHVSHFDRYQNIYSQQLDADVDDLGGVLHMDRLGTSLWLADGNGFVISWAANDRTYRSAKTLLRARTGHDSPVLVGRALAGEEPVWKDYGEFDESPWGGAVAIPIRTKVLGFPPATTAVYLIGFSGSVERVRRDFPRLEPRLRAIENDWASRLSHVIQNAST
ncbi:SIR2 family protein [Mycetocola saprophilus]|uniref:SIR2 family protein n=1 Tax=Mycetocola saprophilus TaxID=76636 RepID=UPI0006908B56|nr:SIR2 family protein [Mycetocola saprophilus]